MKPRTRNLLIGLSAILWPFFVLMLYYVSHKPFSPELAVSLAVAFWGILLGAILVATAGAIGQRIAPFEDLPRLVRLSLQSALGLGAYALFILIVGATVGLNVWLLGLLPLTVGIALRRSLLKWLRQVSALRDLWRESDSMGRAVAVLIVLLLLNALIVALAPPLKFDALVSHLALPQAYLEAGRVQYLSSQVMSGMPQNAEMLFTWAIALGGLPAATVLGWWIAVLAVVGLLGYFSQKLNVPSAWAAAAALLAGFSLVMLTAWGYVDWLALLFGFGVLALLDRWRRKLDLLSLLLAGAFTGLAVGTKYTSGVLGIAALVTLIWHIWKRKISWQAGILDVLKFSGAALCVAAPWLLKNLLTTGNPLYPFFFSAGAMTPLRLAVYQSVPPYGNWLDFIFLPLRATYMGVEAGDGYMVALGPLLLGFGLFAWLGRERRGPEQQAALENAAVLALSGLLVWASANRISGNLIQTRYYFTLFPAFTGLAAFGYWGLSRVTLPQVRLNRFFNTLILLVLVFNLLEVSAFTWKSSAPQAAAGLMTGEDYLADNLGWYQRAMQAVRELPAGSRVLMLYEPRSLYCAPTCASDEILDRWKRDLNTLVDPQSILSSWKQAGYTHVLVYTAGVDFMRTAADPHHPLSDLTALDAFLAQLPPPQTFSNVYALYRLQ
ncbi:MAG TPA: hypothetical protein VN452_03135 [Longilinea sp.]|nr:hypothetical protein [Longilinea sp.]